MSKIRPVSTFGLGSSKTAKSLISNNHFSESELTPEVKQKIASMGLNRVAGNIFEKPAANEFWKVQGNKIIKLVGNEVDEHQSIPAADEATPQMSLRGFLDDLEF